jgi:hypothetical protein
VEEDPIGYDAPGNLRPVTELRYAGGAPEERT